MSHFFFKIPDKTVASPALVNLICFLNSRSRNSKLKDCNITQKNYTKVR